MKAIVFDNELKLDVNYKKPIPEKGEALIRVKLAGICNTDYEITKDELIIKLNQYKEIIEKYCK